MAKQIKHKCDLCDLDITDHNQACAHFKTTSLGVGKTELNKARGGMK